METGLGISFKLILLDSEQFQNDNIQNMSSQQKKIINVILFGDFKSEIVDLVEQHDFRIVEKDFDAVVTYGGDGTIVKSEYFFPSVPKIVLKKSEICKKCNLISNEETLKLIRDGKYTTETLMKLKVEHNGNVLYGMDTVLIHNHNPRHAIRYGVKIDDIHYREIIIGDGFIVATPFGSTGYYKSITGSFFTDGVGVAFNNSTEQVDHLVTGEKSIIKSHILRGPADVYVDNIDPMFTVKEDEFITISVAKEKAYIIRPIVR